MRSLRTILSIAVLSAALAGCGGYYGNGGYNRYNGYGYNAYGYNNTANWGQPPLHSHGEANYADGYGGGLSSGNTCWSCGRY